MHLQNNQTNKLLPSLLGSTLDSFVSTCFNLDASKLATSDTSGRLSGRISSRRSKKKCNTCHDPSTGQSLKVIDITRRFWLIILPILITFMIKLILIYKEKFAFDRPCRTVKRNLLFGRAYNYQQ